MNISSNIIFISKIKSNYTKLVENELKQNGLNDLIASQVAILSVLYKYNHMKLNMTQIAKLINRDNSTVTQLIDKLVKDGYVKKKPAHQATPYGVQKDIRVNKVTFIILTKKSKGIKDKVSNISKKVTSIAYNNFTEGEKEKVMEYLSIVQKNFESVL